MKTQTTPRPTVQPLPQVSSNGAIDTAALELLAAGGCRMELPTRS
jgi:hypothetical protein